MLRDRAHIALALSALVVLSACTRFAESEGIVGEAPARKAETGTDQAKPGEPVTPGTTVLPDEGAATADRQAAPEYHIYRGTGDFVRNGAAASATAAAPVVVGEGGNITLNFSDADIRQVIKTTLGDILGLNYVIAPDVQGAVTVQTDRALTRDALFPAIESILRLHGVALVLDGAIYRVETLQGGARSLGPIRFGAGKGYGVQVVQLRYVSAEDMRETLAPMAGENAILHVDKTRNLLILAGTQPELNALLDSIRIFDVDWLAGMSFGLFTLESAEPKTVIDELHTILDTESGGALAGLVRLMPIERLNAVLAISQQPRYLDEVRRWIQRLDRATQAAADRQLFIYYVQNGKAKDLADVLNQVFGEREDAGGTGRQSRTVAPGLEPVRIASSPPPETPTGEQAAQDGTSGTQATRQPTAITPGSGQTAQAANAPGLSLGSGARVVADESRNALLISGSHAEYRAVLRALNQLDRRPLEVLIEVTIADVTLSDRLEYGVRWFFQDGNSSVTLSDLTSGAVASTFPGLSYVFKSTNAKSVLDLLSSVTDVKVISAPQILVLDNQQAQLQVGDQVPVATQQSTTTDALGAPVIVNSIELRDTGVILKVTPRVNEGGLVTMEIQQEVSQVNADAGTGTITPTISKRLITTNVAVQSGQTVALGGMIQDNKSNAKVGVPFFSAIPFIGAAFRYTSDTVSRTELLVLVSPHVIRDERGAQEVTDELRRGMEDLERLEAKIAPKTE